MEVVTKKKEKKKKKVKYLSAIPPDTMVVAVVANESWNKKVVYVGPIPMPSELTNQLPSPINADDPLSIP